MNCDKCHQPMPATAEPQRITMDKQYQTRDGRKVTLYCVDAPEHRAVHGRCGGDIYRWNIYGKWLDIGEHNYDLIEVPPPAPEKWTVKGWVNVFVKPGMQQWDIGSCYRTREAADRCGFGRIDCVPITLSGLVGEGLAP